MRGRPCKTHTHYMCIHFVPTERDALLYPANKSRDYMTMSQNAGTEKEVRDVMRKPFASSK